MYKGPHFFLYPTTELITVRHRIIVAIGLFFLAFTLISLRLVNVMLFKAEQPASKEKNFSSFKVQRANIVDRNQQLLATQLITSSVFINPLVILNPDEVVQKLGTLFPELKEEIQKKVLSKKSFVWIARHISPKVQAKVHALGLPGVYLKRDEKRVYPFGSLFAHVVGGCNFEGVGISGAEHFYNERLTHDPTHTLKLTLDARVQYIVHQELGRAIELYKAQGGNAVVMEVGTGQILAMVSMPDFDPNELINLSALFNRNTQGVFENGSTFKILNIAIALDSKCATLKSMYDTSEKVRIGKFFVDDFKGLYRNLSLTESFVYSSNIAAIKISQSFGVEIQKKYFKDFGIFNKVSLLESSNPLFPSHWTPATTMSASYGYGVAVSPLQMIRAVHAIVNQGMLVEPTLTFGASPNPVQVVSSQTSKIVLNLMRQAVQAKAKKADIDGYNVCGKTGTAYLRQGKHGYGLKKKRLTSFIGVFPKDNPKYLVFVMLNNPQPIASTFGYAAGGWNASPTAGNIIRRIAPILYVLPENIVSYKTPRLMWTGFR